MRATVWDDASHLVDLPMTPSDTDAVVLLRDESGELVSGTVIDVGGAVLTMRPGDPVLFRRLRPADVASSAMSGYAEARTYGAVIVLLPLAEYNALPLGAWQLDDRNVA